MASNTVEKRGDKMRGSVAVALMLLLTIGALAYFMPRESKFGYEYELYRPWRYAPFFSSAACFFSCFAICFLSLSETFFANIFIKSPFLNR